MEKFLESLESRLSILEESERKRIIQRYQKEIEEKLKDGLEEKDAIQSLGSLDSIIEEIYKEYHLDEKYVKENNNVGGKLNNAIRKCAVFLSDTCAEIAYYVTHISNNSLETFFEIFLKILLLIIVFLVLKIPFLLLEDLCYYLFGFLFYPFDSILLNLSDFVIGIIYLMLCISLGIYMFKGYATQIKDKNNEKKKEEKTEPIKSSKEARNYAYAILKVMLYIIAIIPLILLSIVLIGLTLFAFFLVYKGVNVIGLAVFLIGLVFLNIIVTTYITDALDNRSRSHTLALIVAVIALISGSILLVDNLMSFEYLKTLEESSFQPFVESRTIEIPQNIEVTNYSGEVEFILDNSIRNNEIILEVEYYDNLYGIFVEKDEEDSNLWIYTIRDDFEVGNIHYLYHNSLEDLKNGKIYNYQKLNTANVKIYGNEETSKLVHINK